MDPPYTSLSIVDGSGADLVDWSARADDPSKPVTVPAGGACAVLAGIDGDGTGTGRISVSAG
jgi:hypothetical protein